MKMHYSKSAQPGLIHATLDMFEDIAGGKSTGMIHPTNVETACISLEIPKSEYFWTSRSTSLGGLPLTKT